MHHHAVTIEAHLRLFCVRIACGARLALEVIPSVLREELLVQRALQRLRRDLEVNGVCRACQGSRSSKNQGDRATVHDLRIMLLETASLLPKFGRTSKPAIYRMLTCQTGFGARVSQKSSLRVLSV